jgi:subtilisin family serine protease
VTEYPVEDFWIAGAEFADLGADIITSSLGYFAFDDPGLDYKYSDMDGDRAFVTRAADIAASKGMLVVCSAGNERTNDWLHIIAPSDGDSVLAVGAVNSENYISEFSSAGPSYDRRVKPDIVAQGVSVPVQTQTSVTGRANGTSFSCPVISGMCACVMQAVPQATSYDILTEIHSVSDRYHNPDSCMVMNSQFCRTYSQTAGKTGDKTHGWISCESQSFFGQTYCNFQTTAGKAHN